MPSIAGTSTGKLKRPTRKPVLRKRKPTTRASQTNPEEPTADAEHMPRHAAAETISVSVSQTLSQQPGTYAQHMPPLTSDITPPNSQQNDALGATYDVDILQEIVREAEESLGDAEHMNEDNNGDYTQGDFSRPIRRSARRLQ